jgi:hypothetical protein
LNGTYLGGVTHGVAGIPSGDGDSAITLDGSTGYLRLSSSLGFSSTQPFTLEAWVNPSLIDGSYRRIFGKDYTDSSGNRQGFAVWVQNSWGLGFERFQNGAKDVVLSSAGVPTGSWSHVAATYDGSTMQVYVNGRQVGRTSSTRSILSNSNPLDVGASPWGPGYNWQGSIDEVAVYEMSLSDSRILAHYQAGVTATGSGSTDPTSTPTMTPATPTSAPMSNPTSARTSTADGVQTQYAMFYHPPQDGTSLQSMSTKAKALIFTHGDESYLSQMRDYGFTGPALEYLMANETSGPANLIDSSVSCGSYLFYPNNLAGLDGDFCTALHPVESNFLHNSKGQRLYSTQSWVDGAGKHTVYVYLMNPAAPGWQAYVASHLRTLISGSPYTGIFLDNLDLAPTRGQSLEDNSDGTVQEYSSTSAYQASMQSYLAAYQAALPDGMKLWANMTEGQNTANNWEPYLAYLDGVMDEAFATGWSGFNDPTSWLAQVERMEKVLGQGKSFLGVAQGSQDNDQMQQFGLASYLLASGNNAYFRYSNYAHYYDAWWYSNYASKLGAPRGARYQNSSGLWERDFACGSVTVDTRTHIGTITTNSSLPGCS